MTKGPGRLEVRRYWTISDPALRAYLDPTGAWVDLHTIVPVEAERRRAGPRTVDTRDVLSSLPSAAAARGQAVRRHWQVENRLHWVLDVAFREDDSRVRVGDGTQNFALLRHLALHLLRQERSRWGRIATKRFRAALADTYLRTLLEGLPVAT